MILRSLFATGDSLISLADENKRERLLTRDEEVRLLATCDAPQRVNANVETAKRAAAALDAFNAETTEAAPNAELVH